jgi:hypothetical protein
MPVDSVTRSECSGEFIEGRGDPEMTVPGVDAEFLKRRLLPFHR